MATMQHFSSDGIDIAFLDAAPEAMPPLGQTPDPVLLIHGFASNAHTNWVDPGWVRTLTRAGYRVIAIDNRGHGHSAKLYDEAAYTAAIMAGDALRLLEHLQIARASVMGYSMGARITAFLMVSHSERVGRAIFGGLGINMVRGLAGAKPIAAALLAPTMDDVHNATARTFRAFAESTGSDLRALAACMLASRGPVTAEQLGQITTPVLVAVGTDDVIGGSAEELAKLIPGAQWLAIEGRDHMRAVGDRSYKDAVLGFLGQAT
jgi:pimeloyl-ACP methyl ester carboxylesterase